jgi:hypothetical protein
VNVHILLAASALPNLSFAPVETVAVKEAFGGPRGRVEGVKVATLVATM